jgi:hypothetical protein
LSHSDEVGRLGSVEARGPHQLLDVLWLGCGQRGSVGEPGKQGWRGLVDASVGALGGQDGGSQQLEGIGVIQGAEFSSSSRKSFG